MGGVLLSRRWIVALLAVLVVPVTGCGSDDDSGSAPATWRSQATTSRTAAPSGPAVPIPTAAELDGQIKRALDRNVPDDERIALIEDGEAFRGNIPDLFRVMQENPAASYAIVDPVFDNHDGTITATAKLDKDGTGRQIRTANVHFILIDGKWKVSRTDLCGILLTADFRTPACG